MCGLGPHLVGIHSISLAARYRTAACSNTLDRGLEKIQAARAFDFAPTLALCSNWEKEFPPPSIASSTADAFDIVRCLDHDGKLDEVSQDKRQKVATSLLCDKLLTQDFAGSISLRASKVLGPISRYRFADILHHMKDVSRVSRPGLTVGFLCILCNVLCTAQRFHTEGDEQTCRVGCPNEPDSLSLSLQRMPILAQNVCFCLETSYCASMEKPSSPRLNQPSVLAKPPIWDRGDGLHRLVRLCSSSTPPMLR